MLLKLIVSFFAYLVTITLMLSDHTYIRKEEAKHFVEMGGICCQASNYSITIYLIYCVNGCKKKELLFQIYKDEAFQTF